MKLNEVKIYDNDQTKSFLPSEILNPIPVARMQTKTEILISTRETNAPRESGRQLARLVRLG